MPRFYVISGAFPKLKFAIPAQQRIKLAGFNADLIKSDDGCYKIQIGDFPEAEPALRLLNQVKSCRINCILTCKSGTPVTEEEIQEAQIPEEVILKKRDKVTMEEGAPMYGTNRKFDDWVYNVNLYIRYIDGDCFTVSHVKTGPVLGNVHKKYLTKV